MQTFSFGQIKHIGLPEVRNYKKAEYRAATQNWDIAQDANGLMYFANNDGLLQFDGSFWALHKLPASPVMRSLKLGSNGRVYVGGYSEFGYFEPGSKGSLEYHSLARRMSPRTRSLADIVWKIHIVGDEVIFQSFGQLFIYKKDKLTILEAPGRFQFSYLVGNKLFIQDAIYGLLLYDKGKLRRLPGTHALTETEVWGVLEVATNKFIIATIDHGLFEYANGKLTAWNTPVNRFLKANNCLGGTMIGDKFIAFNSVLDGLVISDLSGNIIQHIDRKKGLQNNTVLTSFVDANGNLWLGLDNGIAFVNESSPFTYFGFSYDLSSVYASVRYKGKLYVATNRGVYYHDWEVPFREKPFKLVEGTAGQAWNLQVVEGSLFCAHNRGALVIEDGRVRQMLDPQGYWFFAKVPGKEAIIASNYSGFSIIDKVGGGWRVRNRVRGFDEATFRFEVDGRFIWFVKNGSICQAILSDDLQQFRSVKMYPRLSASDRGVTSIQRLDGKVLFQYRNHFYSYSSKRDLFLPEKTMTALFKNTPPVRTLFQDSEGTIWYVFGESIAAFRKEAKGTYKRVSAPFSVLNGNMVARYENVFTLDSSNIFIGLADGLAHYDTPVRQDLSVRPKVFIRTFSSSSDTVAMGNGGRQKKICDLPYTSNDVSFTFSSPTYEHPENLNYAYKLEGFDNQWSAWSPLTLKEYTNLHEGQYEMKVWAKNTYGVVSEPFSVVFSVRPPWYRHFLAYLLYLVLFVLGLYLARRRVISQIRKNKYYQTVEQRRLYLEKEAKIKQEQFELEKEIEHLKNERLKINLLTKDKELVNNSLQVVKKNKVLNGIIHRMKDIDSTKLDDQTRVQLNKLSKSISKEVASDKSWKDLEKHIRNVHFDFLKRLKEKFPAISPRELDLATYLLMNMSTKEIAEAMNISQGGVELARYRLRKKLGLTQKENLIGYLMGI